MLCKRDDDDYDDYNDDDDDDDYCHWGENKVDAAKRRTVSDDVA